MKKEDLDALSGLYEGLYSPAESGEYLSEEYLEEYTRQADRPGQTPAEARAAQQAAKARGASSAQAYQSKANAYKPPGLSGVLSQLGRFASGPSPQGRMNSELGRASKPAAPKPTNTPYQSRFAGARDAAVAKAKQIQGSPVVGPKPTEKPALPGSNAPTQPPTAKVAPTAAAKPAGQTGDKAKDMATWAKANPTLANKPKTPNPLMQKTFGYQKGGAPDQVAKTAAATSKAASNLSGTGALAAKPTPSTSPIKKPGAVMSSFEWGSKATLKDVESLYSSIYEAKKKDQDQDGDNDFADVQIARMIASGMSKAEAIAAVKNKEYNEEYELDEATRMRKELGKEGETATRKELASRSRAHKRSGSVDKTIAAAERGADRPYVKFKRDESDVDRKKREEKQSRTLRRLAASRRGSVRGEGGLRGYAAKVEGSDRDLQFARGSARSAGTLTPAEKKKLGEDFELWVESLVDEGYDLSEYTWDEMFDIYEAEGSYGETPKAYSAARKTKMTAKRKPFLKAMLRRTNPAERKDAYGSPRKGMSSDDRERARAGSKHGVGTRDDHDYPSEGPGGVTKNPKKLRKQKAMGEFAKEEYQIYEIVASYLLENNFAETIDDANVIIENMSETWVAQILESFE